MQNKQISLKTSSYKLHINYALLSKILSFMYTYTVQIVSEISFHQ